MSKLIGKLKGTTKVADYSSKSRFKRIIRAQCASAAPPLGPILGNFGLNIANFCKVFNEMTLMYKKGIPLPTTVKIKPDRSFDIIIETPPISYYLKQAAGLEAGKLVEENGFVGKISIKHIYEIAKIKYEDPNGENQLLDFPEVVKKINGLAFTCGIEVVKDLDAVEYQKFLDERYAFLAELKLKKEEEAKAKLMRAG